ncbi:MAG: hypothetical protein ACE37F_10830 [Nannocystaceae bacterium]|nr:hypothetical protein [bacterium]
MDLKRLPPSMLVALGLAAAPAAPGCTVSSCLDVAGPEEETSSTGSTEGTSTVGPCLDVDPSTVGPCLGVEPGTSSGGDTETDGTGTGTGTGTDTDTDTDTDGGTSTGGASAAADERGAVLGRLLDAGVLPPDVAAKLSSDGGD